MRSASELPDVVKFNSLDIKKAEEVVEEMKSASELPDIVTFSSLFDDCAKQGDTKEVVEIFECVRWERPRADPGLRVGCAG